MVERCSKIAIPSKIHSGNKVSFKIRASNKVYVDMQYKNIKDCIHAIQSCLFSGPNTHHK